MITYIHETRPFEIMDGLKSQTKMDMLKNRLDRVQMPEHVTIRYATYRMIEGVLMCYDFDGSHTKEAYDFIKHFEDEPLIRGLDWFLGVSTGTDGAMEIVAFMPWNCTKFEFQLAANAFNNISVPTFQK